MVDYPELAETVVGMSGEGVSRTCCKLSGYGRSLRRHLFRRASHWLLHLDRLMIRLLTLRDFQASLPCMVLLVLPRIGARLALFLCGHLSSSADLAFLSSRGSRSTRKTLCH